MVTVVKVVELDADRVRGVLLGLAAGDRNGGPIRMAKRLAESLAARRAFDRDDVARRWHEWFLAGHADDEGSVTRLVLRSLPAVVPFRQQADAFERAALAVDARLEGETAGCNPLHRAAPLAMALFIESGSLAAAAIAEARLTHVHPLAGEASAACVVICRALAEGRPWDEAVALGEEGRLPEVARAVGGWSGTPPGRGGYSPEVLHAALHFAGRGASFVEAMEEALRFAGGDNFCPVTVGALAGARWGASAIPASMLEHPKARKLVPRLEKIASRLLGTEGANDSFGMVHRVY